MPQGNDKLQECTESVESKPTDDELFAEMECPHCGSNFVWDETDFDSENIVIHYRCLWCGQEYY